MLGVVRDRRTGEVLRIINPDHDWELDRHHIEPNEELIRVSKAEWGVSGAMTLEQVYRLASAFNK